MKILLWILLAPIGMIFLGIAGTEINKAYWDRQVTKLCMEEGGVTVYETVVLTPKEFLDLGGIKGKTFNVPGTRTRRARDFPYVADRDSTYIRRGYPDIWRSETTIYRKEDNRALGKLVTYSRVAGDFPVPIGHHSSFNCFSVPGFEGQFEKKIFIIQGE